MSEIEFISEKRKKLEILQEVVENVLIYFHALALLQAYVNMIALLEQKTRGHPEVRRVPALVTALIEHFQQYPLEHINIQKDQIFNRGFIGTIGELLEWQQAGYPLIRNDDDYERRVDIFKAIWRQMPVSLRVDRVSSRGKKWIQTITFRPRNMNNFTIPTYEEIIQSRDSNYASVVRYVPFWMPLNYGTGGLGGSPGYPAVPGIFFVDTAEQLIDHYLNQAAQYVDRYVADVLDDDSSTLVSEDEWARVHVRTENTYGLDIFSLAAQFAL